jgi:hydroxyisourate hydrolase
MSDSILSLHVLDTSRGQPGAFMRVELRRLAPDPAPIADVVTDANGRAPVPLLPHDRFVPGTYELCFHVAAYFRRDGRCPEPPFLDVVPVRVGLHDASGHYHVPLQVTPFAYATYRGN